MEMDKIQTLRPQPFIITILISTMDRDRMNRIIVEITALRLRKNKKNKNRRKHQLQYQQKTLMSAEQWPVTQQQMQLKLTKKLTKMLRSIFMQRNIIQRN